MTFLLSFSTCIEPFEFETREAEGILVVQATLTDELGKQVVILSRAADLEAVNIADRDTLDVNRPRPIMSTMNDRVNGEQNANVMLVDDLNNEFVFEDIGNGVYESVRVFSLEPNVAYQLRIRTVNDETYESDFKSLSGKSQIDTVYAERNFNDKGEEGITIFADGTDYTGNADFFRYTYVDTYKIIPPNWNALELEIIRDQIEVIRDSIVLHPDVKLVRRTNEEQVCYNSQSSFDINLANTSVLDSPDLRGHVVRFLNRNNPIISHRYSILLTQYIIDNEAYNYYQSLSNFAQSESVFSEIQPGFLEGNIRRTDMDDGQVLGYFEVASVAKQRFFFDYVDFFPNEELPPYFGDVNCDRLVAPALGNPERDGPIPMGCDAWLLRGIKDEIIEYVASNEPPGECEGPYLMTFRACGDCTLLGSNIKPDFWID